MHANPIAIDRNVYFLPCFLPHSTVTILGISCIIFILFFIWDDLRLKLSYTACDSRMFMCKCQFQYDIDRFGHSFALAHYLIIIVVSISAAAKMVLRFCYSWHEPSTFSDTKKKHTPLQNCFRLFGLNSCPYFGLQVVLFLSSWIIFRIIFILPSFYSFFCNISAIIFTFQWIFFSFSFEWHGISSEWSCPCELNGIHIKQ